MKLVVSQLYDAVARGAAKELRWKMYIRRVTTRDQSLASGWTEITSRIDFSEFTGVRSSLESEFGQFEAMEVELRGLGIDWWRDNWIDVNARNPKTIPKLAQWLKADAIADAVDGDLIAKWLDQSGSNLDPSEATNKPTYKVNIVNSKPILRFDGVNDKLSIANASAGILSFERTDKFSIHVLLKRNSIGTVQTIIRKAQTTSPFRGYWLAFLADNKITFELLNTATTNQIKVTTINAFSSTSAWYSILLTYDGSSTANGVKIYINGVAEALTVDLNNLTATTLNTVDVFYAATDASSHFLAADVAEIIIRNGNDMTQSEREGQFAYLACKYAQTTTPSALCDDYLEIKIEANLVGTSEIIPMFAGFIDRVGIEFDDESDSVIMRAYSHDDAGARLPAERISTQIINPDVDGSGTAGIVLQKIPQTYVVDAALSGYELSEGVHTIEYDFNNGSRRARLDRGNWISLTSPDANYTLSNPEDTQRVKIYTRGTLPSMPVTSEGIIVLQRGKKLPNQWHQNCTLKFLLEQLFKEVGSQSVTFTSFEIDTFNRRSRAFIIDAPPADASYIGATTAITTDGTDLFISKGTGTGAIRVYKKNIVTGVYTMVFAFTESSALKVLRMWWNARNGHLWIYYRQDMGSGNFDHKVRRWNGTTLTNAVTLEANTSSTTSLACGMDLLDYEYSEGNFKYGIIATRPLTNAIAFLQSSDMSLTNISGVTGDIQQFLFVRGNEIFYKVFNNPNYDQHRISIDNTGAFIAQGLHTSNVPGTLGGVFNTSSDRVYYGNTSRLYNSATTMTHGVTGNLETIFYSSADQTVYVATSTNKVWSIVGTNQATEIADGTNFDPTSVDFPFQLTYLSSSLWAVDDNTKLLLISSRLPLMISHADFSGKSVRDVITELMQVFNLIGYVRVNKTAFVFKRCDDDGVPLTTGNSVSIAVKDASQIVETRLHVPRAEVVKVSNGAKTMSYDGAFYDSEVLLDKRTVQINSSYIRDDMLKDIARFFFEFHRTDKHLYKIELGAVPLFHVEPFDGASIVFDTTRVKKTATGILYASECTSDGNTILEILI